MRKLPLTAALLALTAVSPLALAHQAGDIIIRAGAATVDPHEDSGNISAAAAGGKATPSRALSRIWARG